MPESTDIKNITFSEVLNKLQNLIRSGICGTSASHAKAVESLNRYMTVNSADNLPFSRTILTDWLISLSIEGISHATATHYLSILAPLCQKIPGGCGVDPEQFKQLKRLLSTLKPDNWKPGLSQKSLDRLCALTASEASLSDDARLTADLIVASIYTGRITLSETVSLKTEEVRRCFPALQDIVDRWASPRRKYLFPFHQSERTPAAAARDASIIIGKMLTEKGIETLPSVEATLRSYFFLAALRQGISPSCAVSALGSIPGGIPAAAMAVQVKQTEEQRRDIVVRTAAIFMSRPRRWYVMKLRPGASYEKLTSRLTHLPSPYRRPTLFYPCDEIVRRVGHRKIMARQAILADIVFFNCHDSEIQPLFRQIGDLAWCYRTDGPRGGDYAPVPQEEFDLFQRTIGHFTPDYDVAPIGAIPVSKDTSVVVIGGPFQGQTAAIDAILDTPRTGVIYRLRLLGDNGLEWQIHLDPRLVARRP